MIICTYKSRFNDGIFSLLAHFMHSFIQGRGPRSTRETNPQPQWIVFMCTNIVVAVVLLPSHQMQQMDRD